MKNLLSKGMTPFTLVLVCVVMIAVTAILVNSVNVNIEELESARRQLRLEQIGLEAEKSAYQTELNRSETDSYIIKVAREKYGYLMPGEIRFHITNIDDLYAVHEVTAEEAE